MSGLPTSLEQREMDLTRLVNDARSLAATTKDIDLRGALMLSAQMLVAQFILRPSTDQIVDIAHALVAVVDRMPSGVPEPPL